MLEESGEVLFHADEQLARRIVSRDEEIDADEVGVEIEVVRLAGVVPAGGSRPPLADHDFESDERSGAGGGLHGEHCRAGGPS